MGVSDLLYIHICSFGSSRDLCEPATLLIKSLFVMQNAIAYSLYSFVFFCSNNDFYLIKNIRVYKIHTDQAG